MTPVIDVAEENISHAILNDKFKKGIALALLAIYTELKLIRSALERK